MEYELSKGMVNAGKDYVNKGFENVNFKTLQPYFDINNTYIIKKILLIIFPFKTSNWNTQLTTPDLYIPLMSYLTYILLYGYFKSSNNITSVLSSLSTKLITYEILLGIIVKFVAYFMDINELGFIDFICYSGYKFVIVLLLMLNLRYIKYVYRIYLAIAFFFFLSRSLKGRMCMMRNRRRKIYFLFIVVILEMFLVFLLAK